MQRTASIASLLATSALALILGAVWLRRAALPYNEEGRFFDEIDSVVYTDAAVVTYAGLTILSGAAALASLLWARRAWRK